MVTILIGYKSLGASKKNVMCTPIICFKTDVYIVKSWLIFNDNLGGRVSIKLARTKAFYAKNLF